MDFSIFQGLEVLGRLHSGPVLRTFTETYSGAAVVWSELD